VPDKVLADLDQARESVRLLAKFLDTALDKWDGRYDYRTYLALDMLPLPGTAGTDQDPVAAQRLHDRLVVQLTADAVRFELDVLDGQTQRFPQQRPDSATVAKRFRLALRATEPLNRRFGGAQRQPEALGHGRGIRGAAGGKRWVCPSRDVPARIAPRPR